MKPNKYLQSLLTDRKSGLARDVSLGRKSIPAAKPDIPVVGKNLIFPTKRPQ
jgi:hypothetical protein